MRTKMEAKYDLKVLEKKLKIFINRKAQIFPIATLKFTRNTFITLKLVSLIKVFNKKNVLTSFHHHRLAFHFMGIYCANWRD